MILFDFIYFCIYSFVPDKAIFGKRDVACTLYSSFSGFFMMGLWTVADRFLNYHPINVKLYVGIVIGIIFGGLFILIRKIYLRPVKFKSMYLKFGEIPKWLLKTIGILYVLFCFASFVFCGIVTSLR